MVLFAWRTCAVIAISLTALLASPAFAETQGKVVVVGLRPVTSDGAGDLARLVDAQAFRAVFQLAFEDVLGQRVYGHDDLVKVLGGTYLVTWFKCGDDLPCISNLLRPAHKENYETAITGEYTVAEERLRVRVVAFRIADRRILKEHAFDAPLDAAKDVATWRSAAVRILASARLRIRSNVTGAACTIDGRPCEFESDQQTIAVMPGEHTIELVKAGYERATAVVNVTADGEQEVSLPLRPEPPKTKPGDVVAPVKGEGITLPAVRTAQKVTIDGKLDDAAWSKAWLETNFTQKFPDENKPPTQRTEVRVLFNNESLYIGVRCFDTRPQDIIARLTRRDRAIDGDRVTIGISSKNDRASAFHFQVNAAGVQLDGLWFNDTQYNNDWDGRWYSATTTDDQGWTVELEIPLVTLRYAGDVSSFGFQVRRYLGRRGEIDEWAYIPSTEQGEVSYYGTLADVTGLKAKRLFEILVFDSRSIVRRTGQGMFDGTTSTDRLGADVRLGLTSQLTLDGTFNPDFGTVEVDQVVLNLTTIENFFPERRRFFIEGAELFQTPLQLFYSRRIGARPPDPSTGTLIEPLPNTGQIWGAVKVTGVLAGRLSIAVLDGFTARQDARVERASGETETLLVDPATNFGVLRLKQEFGTNSYIGFTATAVNRIEPAGAAAPQPGDGCPVPYTTEFTAFAAPTPVDGRCTNDAYTAGVDTVLRSSDGQWSAAAQIAGSHIQNGPTQVIPDGTRLGSGDSGFGAALSMGRYGGGNWLFDIRTQHLSPRFQLNDVGFLGAANLHELKPALHWRRTKPMGPLQALKVSAGLRQRHSFDFQYLATDPYLLVKSTFKNLWTWQVLLGPYSPKWYEIRETQDGARTQRNQGYTYFTELGTNPNKAVVFGGEVLLVNNNGGARTWSGKATLSLRPIPTLELDVIGSVFGDFHNPRWFDTTVNDDGTRTYLFSDLDVRVADVTLRGTYTFSRKLSLQSYLQAFAASGRWSNPTEATVSGSRPTLSLDRFRPVPGLDLREFDFRTGAVNLNLFARYEYLPLSAIWLVYAREQRQSPFDPMQEGRGRLRFDRFADGPATDVVLLKATYLWH